MQGIHTRYIHTDGFSRIGWIGNRKAKRQGAIFPTRVIRIHIDSEFLCSETVTSFKGHNVLIEQSVKYLITRIVNNIAKLRCSTQISRIDEHVRTFGNVEIRTSL